MSLAKKEWRPLFRTWIWDRKIWPRETCEFRRMSEQRKRRATRFERDVVASQVTKDARRTVTTSAAARTWSYAKHMPAATLARDGVSSSTWSRNAS